MKKLFKKLYNKLFRKKTCRIILDQEFDSKGNTLNISPEYVRKQFEAAYPDGAAFLDSIKKRIDKSGNEFFEVSKGIVSDEFLCGKRVNP